MPENATSSARLDPGMFRDILRAAAVPGLWQPLVIFALDLTLYGAAMAGVLFAPHPALRLGCSFAAGVFTVLLFIVGHDACHGSFTRVGWLNQWIGRIAFLPALHSVSLWRHLHNGIHHRYTNLRGRDYAWAPLTRAEFDALSWGRKIQARIYRSGWGHGLYYGYELWWKRTFFPSRRDRAAVCGARVWFDSALVAGFLAGAVAALVWFAQRHGRHPFEVILLAGVIPFAVWNWFIGFATYQHHTHPAVAWFAREEEWSFWESQIEDTVHIRFPRFINAAMHNILEHTAHHACVGIPLYRLNEAQNALEERLAGHIQMVDWTPRDYVHTLRCCKLYDYERHQWLDFDGQPTAPPAIRADAPRDRPVRSPLDSNPAGTARGENERA